MRQYLYLTVAFTLMPVLASAQNYISAPDYNSASIVVNMDVLGNAPAARRAPPVPMRPPVAMVAPRAPLPIAPQLAPIPPMPVASAPAPVPPSPMNDLLMDNPVPAPIAAKPASAPALPPPLVQPPEEMMTASLPKPAIPVQDAAPIDDFEAYRLLFDDHSDILKPSETAVLDKIITKMNATPALRLQVHAYANGRPETAGFARRLSLTRAMKVREYLTQKNIAATRLDIRALGMGSAEMGDEVGHNKAPADRVDVIFVR